MTAALHFPTARSETDVPTARHTLADALGTDTETLAPGGTLTPPMPATCSAVRVCPALGAPDPAVTTVAGGDRGTPAGTDTLGVANVGSSCGTGDFLPEATVVVGAAGAVVAGEGAAAVTVVAGLVVDVGR